MEKDRRRMEDVATKGCMSCALCVSGQTWNKVSRNRPNRCNADPAGQRCSWGHRLAPSSNTHRACPLLKSA